MLNDLCRYWVMLFATLLAGLMFFNRGFAYLGYRPMFITEIVLASGLLLAFLRGLWLPLLRPRVFLPLVPLGLFVLWGMMRTAPFLKLYGLMAVRDAVLYIYSGFALLVIGIYSAGFVTRDSLIRYYSRLWSLAPFMYVLAIVAFSAAFNSLPRWPNTNVPIIVVKTSDVCAHLCGMAAFYLVGLRTPHAFDRLRIVVFLMILGCAVVVARSGMVAFCGGFGVALAFTGIRPIYLLFAGLCLGMFLLMYFSEVEIRLQRRERDTFSAQRVVDNMLSLVGLVHDDSLKGTMDWRKQWWQMVIQYTFFGPYRMTGKGFGINLAVEDGFVVSSDRSERITPHNIHITILARMGVPGLVLWCAVLISWYWTVFSACFDARFYPDPQYWQFFVVLLSLFTSLLLISSFDVAIEGPMTGVWFWSVYGMGLALAADFRDRREFEQIQLMQ